MSFSYLGLTCLNFTLVELKDELKNRAQARAHNKSSQVELIRKLALIFNLIYFFINLIVYYKFKLKVLLNGSKS